MQADLDSQETSVVREVALDKFIAHWEAAFDEPISRADASARVIQIFELCRILRPSIYLPDRVAAETPEDLQSAHRASGLR